MDVYKYTLLNAVISTFYKFISTELEGETKCFIYIIKS